MSASRDDLLARQLPFGRLVYPTGYANANAALWLIAAWPALLLARSRRVAWALRGAFAGVSKLPVTASVLRKASCCQ